MEFGESNITLAYRNYNDNKLVRENSMMIALLNYIWADIQFSENNLTISLKLTEKVQVTMNDSTHAECNFELGRDYQSVAHSRFLNHSWVTFKLVCGMPSICYQRECDIWHKRLDHWQITVINQTKHRSPSITLSPHTHH